MTRHQQIKPIRRPAQPQPALTREQFLQQYVLARAAVLNDAFDGPGAARSAIAAWDILQGVKK